MLNVFVLFQIWVQDKNRRHTITVLQELLQKAKSSEKAKDGFIAVVSHELRNPLNSLFCTIELI
jgi:signal transduction histidine kinase